MDTLCIFILVSSTLVAYGGTAWVPDLQKEVYYTNRGTPESSATWTIQIGGNQPVNGFGINGRIPESTGVQLVTEERKVPSHGLLQGLLNAGGEVISKTGKLVEGIGETAGNLGNSILGGENGIIPSVLEAGEDVISQTGKLIEGIGETAGNLGNSILGGENNGIIPSVIEAGKDVISQTGKLVEGIGETAGNLGNSILGGENTGLLPSLVDAGGKIIQDTGSPSYNSVIPL